MFLEEDSDAIHGVEQAAEDEAAMQVDDVRKSSPAWGHPLSMCMTERPPSPEQLQPKPLAR
jgi:hypothetical protein